MVLRILAAVVSGVLLTLSTAAAAFAEPPSADRLLILDAPSGYQPLSPATGMTGPTAEHERKGAEWGGDVVSDDGFMRQWAGPCATVVGFALVWNDQDIAKAALTSDVDGAVNDGVEVERVSAVPGARLISLSLSTRGGPDETETVLFRRGGVMFGFTGWNVPRAVLVAFAARQDARARELLDPARMLPDGAAAAAVGPEKRVCGHDAPAEVAVVGDDGGSVEDMDITALPAAAAPAVDVGRDATPTTLTADADVDHTSSAAYLFGQAIGRVLMTVLVVSLAVRGFGNLLRRRKAAGAAAPPGDWSSTL